MAREGALEDPAVPPDVGPPQKHLPRRRGSPDVAAETPGPDVGDPETPGAAPDVADPDVPWAESDSDTDVGEGDPDVEPPKRLKLTQNVPETPDVGLRTPNPDVPWLKNGCGAQLVDSDTDVEEGDPDVQPQNQLKATQNIPETPDVVSKTPGPDVLAPKTQRGAQLLDSDTDVEEDSENPDVQPQKQLKITQNVAGITDVESPNPAVETPKIRGWGLLVESDTDVEEEEDPDVQPQKQLKLTQNVPETPDVGLRAPNPDVVGPKLHPQLLLLGSDTDVEDEDDANPDVQPRKRLRATRRVSESPDVVAETQNPDVDRPKIGHGALMVDSDTDVEEDPDVQPPKRLRITQNVPGTPDVRLGAPYPDVPDPKIGSQAFLVEESDTDVEEDPDVQPPKLVTMTQNMPDTPDVEAKAQNPDVPDPKIGSQAFLVEESDTDVEEDPDVEPPKRLTMTQNTPETPDVDAKTPNPDVPGPKIGSQALLEDSDTDVEEEGPDPDVGSPKTPKPAPNAPETPDVRPKGPNPDVGSPGSRCGALVVESDTDVEEEEPDPDVQPPKRQKTAQNVPESPKGPDVGPDVGRLQSTARIPDVEEGWDPDVATQVFLPPSPDVGSPKELKVTQSPPKIPDVEEEEESDPDVATQLFLPSPDVGSPESPRLAQKDPGIPDVEGPPSLDPDVATQLFLPPNPDVGSPKRPRIAPNPPKTPDVEEEIPDVEEEEESDPDVATQLFLCPNPDVRAPKRLTITPKPPHIPDVEEEEEESDPDVATQLFLPSPDVESPQKAPKDPKIPDVEGPPSLDPDVATQLFLPPNPDVGTQKRLKMTQSPPQIPDVEEEDESGPDVATQLFPPPNPDVGSPKQLKIAPKPPEIPDVEEEEEESGPDVATQLFLAPDPDVGSPKPPLKPPEIPDVAAVAPDPDVGGAPGPAQEALPTPQVRRSQRLAGSSRPHPQSSRSQSGAGIAEATPFVPIKGNGLGLASATPPPVEEPAGGATSRLRPQRATGPAHIRVLFTGLVASPALLVALSSLGGTEASSVRDCSHLVTDGIRRTLKFLCALGRGVAIVTPEWLLQSSHGGRPLSPDPFLPRDPPVERHFRFRLRAALARARSQPLLQGYQVHVTPSVQPCPQDMRDIVTCCGGTFLPEPPRERRPGVLVISCPQDRPLWVFWDFLEILTGFYGDRPLWAPFVAARLPLLSPEFLLSGALRQRLELAPFLLAPLEPPTHGRRDFRYHGNARLRSPRQRVKAPPVSLPAFAALSQSALANGAVKGRERRCNPVVATVPISPS
ncbi:mediator of DNA damage checkpoint protein 1 [Oenanthe melanoleuca]|uniref:mediator of DNA damage checkpoint protein 1 n=1 Tax=Oenanthe melanoleuca TaxID=2939378 RepID=UPI0024C14CFC|nr:mediator of DNA damage checkpoint protein 1 [Oenanthe melanoleuca]